MAVGLPTTAPRNFDEDDEVVLKINGKELRYWHTVKMRFAVDAVSTFTFTAPFDPLFEVHRQMFRPLQYQEVQITIGGELKLTGTVLEVQPQSTANETVVTVAGYGKPGVLANCTMPKGKAKEYRNATLSQICDDVCSAFGLGTEVILSSEAFAAQFKKAALEPDATAHEFLVDLAKQRNALLTDNESGELLVWIPQRTGVARARLLGAAVTSMQVQTNAEEYYTDMVGISGTKRRRKGDLADYANPLLRRDGLIRPSAFRISDADKEESYTIAKGRIGRMFANAAQWTLPNIPSWKDPDGNLWERNTTIKVLAENLMIYRETEFLIRGVTFEADGAKARTTTLDLVLPEVFADEATPEFWPWDD